MQVFVLSSVSYMCLYVLTINFTHDILFLFYQLHHLANVFNQLKSKQMLHTSNINYLGSGLTLKLMHKPLCSHYLSCQPHNKRLYASLVFIQQQWTFVFLTENNNYQPTREFAILFASKQTTQFYYIRNIDARTQQHRITTIITSKLSTTVKFSHHFECVLDDNTSFLFSRDDNSIVSLVFKPSLELLWGGSH